MRRPQQVENISRCMATIVVLLLIGVFSGGLLMRPTKRPPFNRPTTWRDNVPCPDIKEPTKKIRVENIPKLGVVNEYNLNQWDIDHGLNECCFRAFPDGDIYNRDTLAPDWERIIGDRNPYWLYKYYYDN